MPEGEQSLQKTTEKSGADPYAYRYQEVDIENNGTVHLTVIPGKVKTVKL